jgi:hypothetical protein
MIKFFRKIRYNLMEKNKTGKYFKYAIGEIVLVVIGILIAFSINNWNTNRQENLQEVKILKQLRADLIDNYEEAGLIHSEVKLRLRYSDSITIYFNEERKLDDSLVMYLVGFRYFSFFNSANTAYKYIQSEGMNIVSNDSLRAHVTMMYEKEFRNIELRSLGEEKIQSNVLEPFIRKHFKPIAWDTHQVNYVKAQIQPINIEALYGNFEFQNILLEHNAYLQVRNRWLEDSLKKLDKLIEEIQNEITRLAN